MTTSRATRDAPHARPRVQAVEDVPTGRHEVEDVPTGRHEVEDVPTGRHEVAPAILDSAAELFARRGPAAASIREIAAHARVNHGLVFRHFGTKEQLVAAVLDHLAAQVSTLTAGGAPAQDIQAAGDRQFRVIARALLDGFPVGQLQSSFPGAARLLDDIRPRHRSEQSARLATANAAALKLGWQLFEPFLRSATGLLNLTEAELGRCIDAAIATLLDPDWVFCSTDERLREEETGPDERLREEQTGPDERLREEETGPDERLGEEETGPRTTAVVESC